MSRSLWAVSLGAATLVLLLGGWFITGSRDARREAERTALQAEIEITQRTLGLAAELRGRLDALLARENERPYYHFQNLFHDPRGASWGPSVAPSPLADGPGDVLIETHFQIDPSGRLTIPSINEELPELSDQSALADNRARLRSLRAAVDQLRAPELVASLAPRPEPEPRSKTASQQQVIQLSPEAFAQNSAANTVFQAIRKNPIDSRTSSGSGGEAPVTITVSSYTWATAKLDNPDLVARRAVSTPAGVLIQGFVLDRQAVEAWLRERQPRAELVFDPEHGNDRRAMVLGDGVGAWLIDLDNESDLAAARIRAHAVERRFVIRFASIAGGTLALFAMLMFVVFRAERLARQRSQFAAAAAHELRTPLAGLQLYGDMLAGGLGDESRAAEYAQRIADEAGRLGRVVTNVLGFTRLERGDLSTEPRPGDVAAAIRAIVERHRSSLESEGLTIELDLPETLTARFDDDALAQILGNLLDNADKHTRGADQRTASLTACLTRDAIAVEVADSGAGVPDGRERALFEPFSRLGGDDAPAGLGLGLALSRELARSMGGDLRYTGTPGRGARFVLMLPR